MTIAPEGVGRSRQRLRRRLGRRRPGLRLQLHHGAVGAVRRHRRAAVSGSRRCPAPGTGRHGTSSGIGWRASAWNAFSENLKPNGSPSCVGGVGRVRSLLRVRPPESADQQAAAVAHESLDARHVAWRRSRPADPSRSRTTAPTRSVRSASRRSGPVTTNRQPRRSTKRRTAVIWPGTQERALPEDDASWSRRSRRRSPAAVEPPQRVLGEGQVVGAVARASSSSRVRPSCA